MIDINKPEMTAEEQQRVSDLIGNTTLDAVEKLKGTEAEKFPGMIAWTLVGMGASMAIELCPDGRKPRDLIEHAITCAEEDALCEHHRGE